LPNLKYLPQNHWREKTDDHNRWNDSRWSSTLSLSIKVQLLVKTAIIHGVVSKSVFCCLQLFFRVIFLKKILKFILQIDMHQTLKDYIYIYIFWNRSMNSVAVIKPTCTPEPFLAWKWRFRTCTWYLHEMSASSQLFVLHAFFKHSYKKQPVPWPQLS
jgi:hypothetical protein